MREAMVINGKIRPPQARSAVVPRPRIAGRIAALADELGVVLVCGTAGAGKTTAVREAVDAAGGPVAWLTLDAGERAPGRLLTYLEAALTAALPDLEPAATRALESDVSHVEAAGLLADAVGDRRLTLVVDELERLVDAEPALATLSSFVRFAPAELRVILVSRRDIALRLGSARELGGVARITEDDLALSVAEAEQALALVGKEPSMAGAAVAATGGWVAGVLFEAWRSPHHRPGRGGAADPLSGYLSSEIMRSLDDRERRFLVSTSLLSRVTPTRAAALGERDAADVLRVLRTHHLPVSFTDDGGELRCHPRFREYLQQRLAERHDDELRGVHAAHGALLVSEGRDEEAVAAFLTAEDLDAAEAAGERTIDVVLRRRDFAVAERWLKAFRPASVAASERLTHAALVVAVERESWVEGAAVADRLRALSAARGATELEPSVAGTMASCYAHVGRLEDTAKVIDHVRPGPQRDAWRFVYGIGVALVDGTQHFRDRPPDQDTAVDGFLARVDVSQGRFDRVLAPRRTPWAAAQSGRLAALVAVGRLDEALAVFDETSGAERSPARTRLWAELMAELGRPEEAWRAVERSRALLVRGGSLSTMLHHLLEAMLELRLRHDPDRASAALARAEAEPTASRRLRIVEQLQLWRGLAALQRDDLAEAATQLRSAIELMREWDRLYYLPIAGVYLAETAWRLGDEDEADAAADLALAAAGQQGSDHLLLGALREFPSVVPRRLDAERGTDSPWHRLGRVLASEGAIEAGGLLPRTHVHEFGACEIVADDGPVRPKLTRSVEVLAYLAAQGGRTTRAAMLDDLFDGRVDDAARAYLRQALSRLREALPDDAPLLVAADEVRWDDPHLTSDSTRFQRDVRQALHLQGRARLDAALDALQAPEAGPYLQIGRSRWAVARREALDRLAGDARQAAAETAFDLGEFDLADEQVSLVVRDDPFRESAWRLAMRIAAAKGDDDRVIALYRRCRDQLAELPTEPAASTQRLLTQLRR